MATAIDGATLIRVPGAAHLAPVEQPDAVTNALRELVLG
jgi:pimeloyl-ACP methyl ester carboxylesterase